MGESAEQACTKTAQREGTERCSGGQVPGGDSLSSLLNALSLVGGHGRRWHYSVQYCASARREHGTGDVLHMDRRMKRQ